MFCSSIPSSRDTLTTQRTLELVSICLDNARKSKDLEVSLQLCDDAEAGLSRIKGVARTNPTQDEDRALYDGIATAYFNLGELQDTLGKSHKAQASFKKVEQWG